MSYEELQQQRADAARALACNRNPLTEQRYAEATAKLNHYIHTIATKTGDTDADQI